MTTDAETIAQAIRDGFHELATAVQGRDSAGTPQDAPRSAGSPQGGPTDPPGTPGASRDVLQRVAEILGERNFDHAAAWMGDAQALADAGLLAEDEPDCPDATPGTSCGWKTTVSQIAAACQWSYTPQDADQAEALIAYIEALHETSDDDGAMTVGQLGAQHIGKRIVTAEGQPVPDTIQHWRGQTLEGVSDWLLPSDTPCTVEPDHD